MLSNKHIAETEQRFAERRTTYEENKQKLREGRMLEADTPERVAKRMNHLAGKQLAIDALTEAVTPAPPPGGPVRLSHGASSHTGCIMASP